MSKGPGEFDFTDRPDDYPPRDRDRDRGDYDRDRGDYDRDRGDYDRDRDRFDVRRRDRRRQQTDLTGVDWVLCVLCPGIACLVGIIRLCTGNPTGGKMIGISFLFGILHNVLYFAIESAKHQ